MQVEPGSLWWSGDGKKFRVLHVLKDDDSNTWVHYRSEGKEPKEYSCFLESFTIRFTKLPE